MILKDTDFLRREETLERLKKARDIAGPRQAEVERILADYNAAYDKFTKTLKPVLLGATEAERKGKNLQLKADYVGSWKTPQDWVEWTFESPGAGKYRVEILLACGKDSGGECIVRAGEAEVKAAVPVTGDWKKYQILQVGTLSLPAGRLTLSVKAGSVKGGGLMNLKTLTLTPAP